MTPEMILIAFAGAVFTLLVLILAWVGARLHTRLDGLTLMLDTKLSTLNTSLGNIERDLRDDLATLDRRVAFIEGGKVGK